MMRNINHILPINKEDEEFEVHLYQFSLEEIRDQVPDLLEWLQDGNWPVAEPIANYFQPHINEIEAEIITVLNTDDSVWKYWILHLILNYDKVLSNKIMAEVKRIAQHPTQEEIEEELPQIATEIIEKYTI